MRTAVVKMRKARAAGNGYAYGYALGVLVGATYREGIQIEKTPVPQDFKAQMAKPLSLLHRVDLQLAVILRRMLAHDAIGAIRQMAALRPFAASVNHAFDSVGLRDCGSNQP